MGRDTQTTSVRCSQIKNPCMETTGTNTSIPDNSWSTATSTNQRTGSEPANASTPGNAEAPECAKAKDGAMVMTLVKKFTSEQISEVINKRLSCQIRLHPLVRA